MIYVVIIILIIISIKSIFSAADTAFTYLNRAEIKQLSKKDKKAEKIRILMEDSNKFFGIIEVSINMCELLASAVVSITILEYLADADNYKYSYVNVGCNSYNCIGIYNAGIWRSFTQKNSQKQS